LLIRRLYFAVCGVATLVSALVVGACSPNDDGYGPIEEYAHALSPDGEVSAYVYHYESPSGGLTQVSLDFVNSGCGTGSAAWHEYDIGVELLWIDATTLEVTYPNGKPYNHNASGDFLGCYDRAVRVVMVPRGLTDYADGVYSKPVEIEHTPSPDRKIRAYTFRYDSPHGGITQVIVNFPDTRGCADSAVTFYDHDIELQLNWIDTATLEVRYPDGQHYDRPPWGMTVRCVLDVVQVKMQPMTFASEPLSQPR
jgi:hypothetical protein